MTKGKDSKPEEEAVESAAVELPEEEEVLEIDLGVLKEHTKALNAHTYEKRMTEAGEFYKRKGTMEAFVDALRDFTKKQKADFLDDAMTRIKGCKPKMNPFRAIAMLLLPLLALMFTAPSYANTANTWSNYPNGWPGGVTIQNLPVLNSYPGNIFWVDSVSGGDGNQGTFQQPFKTVDYAIGRCTADNGDIIMVKPGHAGSVIAAGTITADVAGVTIVGMGNKRNRPTFTWTTAAAASIVVSADDVTIDNLVLDMTGVDAVTNGIYVTGDGFKLRNSEVITADATYQASRAISVINAGRTTIEGTSFYGTSDEGTSEVVFYSTTDATHDIVGCSFVGAYSPNAAIYSATVLTDVNIDNIFVQNYVDGQFAVEFTAAALGKMNNARIATNAVATAVDKGSLITTNICWYDDDLIANDLDCVPLFASGDSAANFIGSDSANNVAATTNVVVNGDGSILERLEYIQDLSEKAVSTSAGGVSLIAGSVANVFTINGGPIQVLDFMGVFTEAASNNACAFTPTMDPTAGTDTVMATNIDLDSLTINSYLTIDGTIANAVVNAIPGTALPLGIGLDIPLVLPPGTIDFTLANSNLTTGSMTWYLRYKPLASGVTVTTTF